MKISIDTAIQTIFATASEKIPSIDIWRPDTDISGGFLEPSGRTIRCPPLLIGDDGNLLFAVISVSAEEEHSKTNRHGPLTRDIRLLGNLLQRAASDYGMHRLLLILALPNNIGAGEELATELTDERYALGQFRIILLPHLNQDFTSFESDLRDKLGLFTPFPDKSFLHRVESSELSNYVESALSSGSYQSNPFRPSVESDLQAYLRVGGWPDAKAWPETAKAIEAIELTLFSRGGNQ
ncbi:hypothetical protein [Myxococcus sp. SDU36]|uniref:hypothetical protein n=1 Tax=Myxococcus sp. SDU36 TaxID=2831967 RepID=UPI0025434E44|nr:hypothetical protein [Myxococcus sp. SDU36]WIG97570.1 hypothetical protein KGD87_09410 [Myxococcus sp. SDU36]